MWFQNRRARDPRKNTRKKKARPLVPEPIHGRVGAPVPRPSQGGLCAPNCLLPAVSSYAQRNASLFSSKPGNASDQAGFGGMLVTLSMNMASHNLPSVQLMSSLETCAALSPRVSASTISPQASTPEDLTASPTVLSAPGSWLCRDLCGGPGTAPGSRG